MWDMRWETTTRKLVALKQVKYGFESVWVCQRLDQSPGGLPRILDIVPRHPYPSCVFCLDAKSQEVNGTGGPLLAPWMLISGTRISRSPRKPLSSFTVNIYLVLGKISSLDEVSDHGFMFDWEKRGFMASSNATNRS